MKQTAAVSLGIFGLNEDFVQVNEIMKFWQMLFKNIKILIFNNLYLIKKNIDKF